jgi:hypothetical protein
MLGRLILLIAIWSIGAVPVMAAAAEDGHPIRVAFVGDSMADGLWGAMFRRDGKDKCIGQKISLLRRARNGTGLTRLDQFNWASEIKTLAKDGGVDLFVGSFGVNDRQTIVEPGGRRTEFGSPAFEDRYKGIVMDTVQSALDEGSSVLIVGLPVMQDPAANADAAAKNRLFAAAVAQVNSERALYVPPWKSADGDEFKPYLPNANGAMIQVRAQDGVHFTPAGYDMVMASVYSAINDALTRRGQDPAAKCEYEAKTK